ncbi:thioredoxin [Paenibacillus tianmuensis]|uniref:Thioredoxin n=1 Tax=Paenibacillus tianmuensis TaxID=624147 RepID=A0A1G4P467_9BACL|nr:thioredoxin [Paenibacillus tianmuensis]SCW27054.1 thioredoxin [Paenibacillus tianmuensis]
MSLKTSNDAEFSEDIRQSELTLVDFTAAWCPPCKRLNPLLEELGQELGERVTILKVDVDASPHIAARFGVMSMPTVILLKDGEPVERLVGLRPKETYRSLIAKYSAVAARQAVGHQS